MFKNTIKKVLKELQNEAVSTCEQNERSYSRGQDDRIETLAQRLNALEEHLGVRTFPVHKHWEARDVKSGQIGLGQAIQGESKI